MTKAARDRLISGKPEITSGTIKLIVEISSQGLLNSISAHAARLMTLIARNAFQYSQKAVLGAPDEFAIAQVPWPRRLPRSSSRICVKVADPLLQSAVMHFD
jgi:hypothetical protein